MWNYADSDPHTPDYLTGSDERLIILSSTTYDMSGCNLRQLDWYKMFTLRGASRSSTVITNGKFYATQTGKIALESLTLRTFVKMDAQYSAEIHLNNCLFEDVDTGDNFHEGWPVRLRNRGIMYIKDSRFENNVRIAKLEGGIINIEDTIFTGNGKVDVGDGIADLLCFEQDSSGTMKNVRFENNEGRTHIPFRVAHTSQVEMEHSALIGNIVHKTGDGGNIKIYGGSLTLRNCEIRDNVGVAAIWVQAPLSLYDTDIAQTVGKAIHVPNWYTGRVYVEGGTAYTHCYQCRVDQGSSACEVCQTYPANDVVLRP